MLCEHDIRDLISRFENDGKYRVLRKLEVKDGRTGILYHGGETKIAIVTDVETTGLDFTRDVIVELAVRRFRYDRCGRILKIDHGKTWFEDPKRPLEPEIMRITGLTDAGLAGQNIDEIEATRLFRTAHLVIAHNASFDRKFVERRLPSMKGMPWACSMSEVDWKAAGFEGRSLGWLGAQAGWFHCAHRASGDVDAVIGLLSHVGADGKSVLRELIEKSAAPTIKVEAFGASFAVKDELRDRGYRWNSDAKVWWREISESDLTEEEAWLGHHVYSAFDHARALGPRLTKVTARERYA